MRRPDKPHVDGFEDAEDCEGYFDPDEADRRRCHHILQRAPQDPCRICFEAWHGKEEAKRKAAYDALTPEEKAKRQKLLEGLRKLY